MESTKTNGLLKCVTEFSESTGKREQKAIFVVHLSMFAVPVYKHKSRAKASFVMDLTLRNVKAVHLSSSVPSGDSMRPVKQAFQISRTNRGVGILCRGHATPFKNHGKNC